MNYYQIRGNMRIKPSLMLGLENECHAAQKLEQREKFIAIELKRLE